MSRNLKDNNEDQRPIKTILNNATLLGLHKNKKFLAKLFDKDILFIRNSANCNRTEKTKIKTDFFRILDLFEDKYKDKADLGFHLDPETDRYIPYFKVIYPEFTITNSKGQSHLIRDLFVYHSFAFTNGSVHPYKLEGGRLSKTELEVISSYQQSHLGSHSSWLTNPLYCSYFCVGGDTDVSRMLAEFEVEMDFDRYELFLFCVDSMVTWESLEGVPFIKMESVKHANSLKVVSSFPSYEQQVFDTIIAEKIPLDVDFYISEGVYKIKANVRSSEFIKKIVLRKFSYDKYKTILVTRVPNTFDQFLQMKPQGASAVNKTKIISKDDFMIFRGRKIYPKIIKEDSRHEKPVSIEDYIVYPKFLENVLRKLESRIYEKAVAKSATKLYHTSNNAQRGVTSDTVSV